MMSEFMINFPAPKIELPYVKMRLIEERKKSFNTDVFGYSLFLPSTFYISPSASGRMSGADCVLSRFPTALSFITHKFWAMRL